MKSELHAAAIIAVISLVTIGLRALPFWIFGGSRKVPDTVLYLGRVLPGAALGMLVVYCLRDLQFQAPGFGLPELAACGAVVAVQLWKHSSIWSIVSGTALYMVLIRLI